MLIKALTNEIRHSAQGVVEMVSLSGVSFVKEYQNRSTPHGLFRLLNLSESDRVTAWVAANTTNREIYNNEVDAAEWLWVPSKRVQPPPRRQVALQLDEAFVPPTFSLNDSKRGRSRQVDSQTSSLIAKGFTVAGQTFSASDAAQLKWLGMYTSRALLSYPVLAPTKDDSSFISLPDEAAVETFYLALLTHVQDALNSGIALKAQIAAATTQAALDAIVDNRT